MPVNDNTLPQKLLTLLDRMIRGTKIKEIPPLIACQIRSVTQPPPAKIDSESLRINTTFQPVALPQTSQVTDIIQNFATPQTHQCSLSDLLAQIHTENIKSIRSVGWVSPSITIHSKAIDLFKKFDLSRRLNYKTRVHTLSPSTLSTQVKSTGFQLNLQIRNKLADLMTIPVKVPPAVLSFISEKEQLAFWKLAIRQAHKSPKQMNLIGIYPGVPYNCATHIEVDRLKNLQFRFKEKLSTVRGNLQKVALFRDLDTQKIISVVM